METIALGRSIALGRMQRSYRRSATVVFPPSQRLRYRRSATTTADGIAKLLTVSAWRIRHNQASR